VRPVLRAVSGGIYIGLHWNCRSRHCRLPMPIRRYTIYPAGVCWPRPGRAHAHAHRRRRRLLSSASSCCFCCRLLPDPSGVTTTAICRCQGPMRQSATASRWIGGELSSPNLTASLYYASTIECRELACALSAGSLLVHRVLSTNCLCLALLYCCSIANPCQELIPFLKTLLGAHLWCSS
jgi:hypothetical protein